VLHNALAEALTRLRQACEGRAGSGRRTKLAAAPAAKPPAKRAARKKR
jgi:hypothetical protein